MIRGTNINTEEDFWVLYPELKIVSEFEQIQKDYKKLSSRVMWYIVLCYHHDSTYRSMDLEARTDLLDTDLMKESGWFSKNKDKIDAATDRVLSLIDTPAKRQKRAWELLLDKRTKFIKSLEYGFDTYEDVDKMAVSTDKIMAAFDKITKLVEKENNESNARGGAMPSLADTDDI